jgi:hypothetical protein
MTNATRDVGGWGELGPRRYQRYVAAFDWVVHCVNEGYYLEAIAVLDSLICERLGSRLGHVTKKPVETVDTCSKLCKKLVGRNSTVGSEEDPSFCEAIKDIQKWLARRNEAMHATAKVLRSDRSPKDFTAILQSHKQDAIDGIRCLRAFDDLDAESRKVAEKIPATSPNAFFPERRGIYPRTELPRELRLQKGSSANSMGTSRAATNNRGT